MAERRKWARPKILYGMCPSLSPDFVEFSISWNRKAKKYLARYSTGLGIDQQKWLNITPQTERLMDLARSLNLPNRPYDTGVLDGDSTSLKIGRGASAKSYEFSFILEADESPLGQIIGIINAMIKDFESASLGSKMQEGNPCLTEEKV